MTDPVEPDIPAGISAKTRKTLGILQSEKERFITIRGNYIDPKKNRGRRAWVMVLVALIAFVASVVNGQREVSVAVALMTALILSVTTLIILTIFNATDKLTGHARRVEWEIKSKPISRIELVVDTINKIVRGEPLPVMADLSIKPSVGNLPIALSQVDLSGADLTKWNLKGVELSESNLSGVQLCDVDLVNSTLDGSNLSGANLSYTVLSYSNLQGANLRGADLRYATLSGVNLREADLHDADLREATYGYDRETIWPEGFSPKAAGLQRFTPSVSTSVERTPPIVARPTVRDAYPPNWDEVRRRVLERDGRVCGNCQSHTGPFHVHHIVPLSRGGTNTETNLRVLCANCHNKIHPHMR